MQPQQPPVPDPPPTRISAQLRVFTVDVQTAFGAWSSRILYNPSGYTPKKADRNGWF